MSGVNAMLRWVRTGYKRRGLIEYSLVCSVEQENECDDRVRGTLRAVLCEDGRADGLQREEDEHAHARGEEEETTTQTLAKEGSDECNKQVPNLKDAVDKELCGVVRDSDCVEDLV